MHLLLFLFLAADATTTIQGGFQPGSIHFEKVKLVKVSAKLLNQGGDQQVPAVEVLYSFRAKGMASDETGSDYYTFSVYFPPEAVPFAGKKTTRAEAESHFNVSTSREPRSDYAVVKVEVK